MGRRGNTCLRGENGIQARGKAGGWEKIAEICQLLKDELLDNGYSYGFCLNNRRIVPNASLGFDEEFARLLTTEYRIQLPEVTKREKVATCLDAVLVMKDILDQQGIGSKIWMICQVEKKKVHSILTFESSSRVIYLELTPQSGKPNYGKELLFADEEELAGYWKERGYFIQDITNICKPGADPSFFMDMIKG